MGKTWPPAGARSWLVTLQPHPGSRQVTRKQDLAIKSVRRYLLKSPRLSLTVSTPWGPDVQTCEPVGSSSHLNQSAVKAEKGLCGEEEDQ